MSHLSCHKISLGALSIIGALTVTKTLGSLAKVFVDCKLRRGIPVKSFNTGNSYAVITGPTSGIGEAFARQLAEAGYNIILVGRSVSKLEELSSEISDKYQVDVKVYSVDFAKAKASDYEELAKFVSNYSIAILVNNAGMANPLSYFEDMPANEWEEVVDVNLKGPLHMAQAVLPALHKNGKGLIWNVGSFSALGPMPFIGPYVETKTAIRAFSVTLAEELKNTNIKVVLLEPYYVFTKLAALSKVTTFRPLPEDYVRAQIGGIGLPGGASPQPYTSETYLPHAFLQWMFRRLLPSGTALHSAYKMLLPKAEKRRIEKQNK